MNVRGRRGVVGRSSAFGECDHLGPKRLPGGLDRQVRDTNWCSVAGRSATSVVKTPRSGVPHGYESLLSAFRFWICVSSRDSWLVSSSACVMTRHGAVQHPPPPDVSVSSKANL